MIHAPITICEVRTLAEGRASSCALLAELLPDVTPYVLFRSSGAPESLGFPRAWGVAGRYLDVSAKSWLESRGLYRGRHPAIFINDLEIRNELHACDEIEPDDRVGVFLECVLGVALHEAGHILDFGVDREPVSPALETRASKMAAYAAIVRTDPDVPPWFVHGIDWARAVCHLRFRALQLGFAMPLEYVFDAHRYSLSPGQWYWGDFMPEMKACVNVPLRELMATRPPEPALALWRSDISRWRDNQASLSSWSERVCDEALAEHTEATN